MNRRLLVTAVTAAVLAIVAGAGILFNVPNTGADTPLLADRQETGFRYRVIAEDDSKLRIEVDYDASTQAGVLAYQAGAGQRAAEYASSNADQRLIADITFNKPLSLEQLQELTDRYGLQPVDLVVRTVDAGGQRGTISGAIGEGESLVQAQEAIERLTGGSSMAEGSSKAQAPVTGTSGGKDTAVENLVNVVGVVAFRTTLLGSSYEAVSSDSNVFLVDALESVLRAEAKELRPGQDQSAINYIGKNPYWYMEDLGLVQE